MFNRFDKSEEKSVKQSTMDSLVATVRLNADPKQILLVPITFWTGMGEGFAGADFTAVRQKQLCIFTPSI